VQPDPIPEIERTDVIIGWTTANGQSPSAWPKIQKLVSVVNRLVDQLNEMQTMLEVLDAQVQSLEAKLRVETPPVIKRGPGRPRKIHASPDAP